MEIDITKTCCFTGHRPEKLKSEDYILGYRLKDAIVEAVNMGYDTFITGMAPGIDIIAAEEVMFLRDEEISKLTFGRKVELKLICAVPFNGVEKNRTDEDKKRFKDIIDAADEVIYISPKYKPWVFLARDKWMVNHASRVIAVFNGTHGGTEFTVDYAKEHGRDIAFVTDGLHPFQCPVCKKYTLPIRGMFEICKECGWEDEGPEHDDFYSGANDSALGEYRKKYLALKAKDPNYTWWGENSHGDDIE